MPIDPRRRVARQILRVLLGVLLGLASTPIAQAVEEDTAPSSVGERAERERAGAPAPRDTEAARGKTKRPTPLIVPSEEVSVDSAISFPADI